MSKKITIDRSRWQRAIPETGKKAFIDQETSLLNYQGNMCCLGFGCEQYAGLKEHEIRGQILPRPGIRPGNVELEKLTTIMLRASGLNDWPELNQITTSAEQEEEIDALFSRQLGVEVEFIN